MENALGITPKFDSFTASSKMCGNCHTINLPNIGQYPAWFTPQNSGQVLKRIEKNPAFKSYNHSIEQATYLEWLNSDFGPGADNTPKSTFKSCQDCHMPRSLSLPRQGIDIDTLTTKIATIMDTGYPATTNAAPAESLTVKHRDNYRRHELVGLNVFLLEMANQFPGVLGVDKTDYMTSATTGNMLAIENMLRQAQEGTVKLAIDADGVTFDRSTNTLTAGIAVTNLTGHRFPSGVTFRRAFVEFLVLEDNDVIWASGRTNAVGLIVDGSGSDPLPTEFLDKTGPDGRSNSQAGNHFVNYQPHYQNRPGPGADLRRADPRCQQRLHDQLHPSSGPRKGQPVASQGVGPLIDVWQESGEDPAGIHESHRSGGTKRCWREGAYRPASPTQWRLEWEEVHS